MISEKELFSPTSRKNIGATASPKLTLTVKNDDEAEKRERRRSKFLELQRQQLNSPSSPANRRQSLTPLSGLSNNQLADHYSSCIKLSAENKINSKNAFGLHLIDYMSELLRNKEMNNFQVASSTLDASTKIYAGRVDAIHSEAYKVLSGLGRGSEKNTNDDLEPSDSGQSQHPVPEKKRKKARKSNTVETNIKNITIKKFDLEFEVDPLFKKTAAAFDEGGSAGLLLNHLHCSDDSSTVVLDSNMKRHGVKHLINKNTVNLSPLHEFYSKLNNEQLEACPAFRDFKFTNWNLDSESDSNQNLDKLTKTGTHTFDLDACTNDLSNEDEPPDVPDIPDDIFEQDDDDAANTSSESAHRVESQEALIVSQAISTLKQGDVGSMLQVLATEPGDYSYFNKNLLQMWAGPGHWKLKAKSKEQPKSSKPKDKKTTLHIDYSENLDLELPFRQTRATTTLTKSTLEKHSKSRSQNSRPEDLNYEADSMFKNFEKPDLLLKRRVRADDNVDKDLQEYDYDNPNDRDNFCPSVSPEVECDDELSNDGQMFGFDYTQTQEIQPASPDDRTLDSNSLAGGDTLIAQPHKVMKIDIGYAKTAKRVDVKKLKSTIWGLMAAPDENKENQEFNENQMDSPQVVGKQSFKNVLEKLPEKVSQNMLKNLSVPIAFVCLLHLANEKELKILGQEGMGDLEISQP